MTNVSATPTKMAVRRALRRAAEDALKSQGYKIERLTGAGKSSLRRIIKDGIGKTVSIRTTQDLWIAFPRNRKGNGWATLEDVDFVIAASVDRRDDPQYAKIHMIPGEEMRDRFDRAYSARKAAGYSLPKGRGIWVSLYEQEASDPVNRVGAGAGLEHKAISIVPLVAESRPLEEEDEHDEDLELEIESGQEPPLTIAEAKRRLALSFGVKEDDVKITIVG